MKKLARILALALALLMALGCCAVAENTPPGYNSTVYSLSIFDPVVYYNDTPMIDLTGATLDLSAAATDTGLLGLFVSLYAGESYDLVADFTAQLDPTGVTAHLAGMSDIYNADVSLLTGINPYFFLSSVPLRTILNSLDVSALTAVSFTPEMRVAAAAQLFAAIAEEPSGSVYPISITAEEGRAMLEALADYIAQVDAETAQEYRAALAEDPSLAFTLDGAMTYDGASISVDVTGSLADSAESFPFSLKYSDDAAAVAVDAALSDASGETLASLTGKSATFATADGRSATDALFTLSVEGEDVATLSYTATPAEGSAQVDHLVSVAAPTEAAKIDVLVQTDTQPEGVGFNFGVFGSMDEESYGFGLQYAGDDYVYDDGSPYHFGELYIFAEDDIQSYGLGLSLSLQKQDMNSADWMLPTENTVDILTMDEAQQQAAMTEAMTVLQEALPALMAGVPGLSALMGGTTQMSAE